MAKQKADKSKPKQQKAEAGSVVVLTSQRWFDPEKYDVKQRQSESIPETWITWLTNSRGEVAIFEKDKMDTRLTGEAFSDDKSKWIDVPFFDEPDDAVAHLWKHRKSDQHFAAQVPSKLAYQIISEAPTIATEIELPLVQPEAQPTA